MLKLRPYQRECIDTIRESHSKGVNRQMVNMATGAGKTVIFGNLIKETGARALVLAHTNELLTQAKDKIEMICPTLDVGLVNSNNKQFDHHVIVSSIQSARQSKNLDRLDQQNFDIVIADEAHHFAAETPRQILNYIGLGHSSNKLLVGFTATAFRSDGRGLGEVFDKITYEKTIKAMIAEGYLSHPNGLKIETDIDFSKVKTSDGDFQPSSLASVMDTPEINSLIVDSYLREGEERQAICFCVTIQHSHNVAQLLKEKGVKAEAISGETPKTEREKILRDYQMGRVQVLCNCQLLTEGFDAPQTSCVIVARPTKSKGLYTQMVGRGLRLYPNKRDCLILDFSDKQHTLCNAATLTKDLEEGDREERQQQQQEKEILQSLPPNLNQKLKAAIVNFDPLGDSFVWSVVNGVHTLKGVGETKLSIIQEVKERFKVILSSNKGHQEIASGLSFDYAFSSAEDFARSHRSSFAVSDLEAPWRDLPASDRQLSLIRSKGFRAGLERLTRGTASDLIASGTLYRKKNGNSISK